MTALSDYLVDYHVFGSQLPGGTQENVILRHDDGVVELVLVLEHADHVEGHTCADYFVSYPLVTAQLAILEEAEVGVVKCITNLNAE